MTILVAGTVGVLACLVFAWSAFGPRSVAGAFLLNWLPLSWPPTVRSALTLTLPESVHRLSGWELRGTVYERLGVRFAVRLLRTPLLAIWNRDIPRAFRARDYAQAEREMRLAEASHAVVFVAVLLVAAFTVMRRWWDAVGYLVAWDLVLNAYPVMAQRYNRARLRRLGTMTARQSDRRGRGRP